MEEKDVNQTNAAQVKPTYEQIEQVAMQLQQRLMIVENRLKGIDFATMRLTWLFKVLENKSSFPAEYVNKCAKEVEEILTIEEATPETATEAEPEEA